MRFIRMEVITARENLRAPLVMRELNAFDRLPLVGKWRRPTRHAEIRSRVASIAELLRIEPYLDRRPGELSGGQRQRVALGRALIREPDLLLLDEPFANLDAALRTHTRSELATLQRRLNTTTVFVTHDQSEAMAMSDRIAVMIEGRIRQVATPAELHRHPADLDVARFMAQPFLNTLAARCVVRGHALAAGETIAIDDATKPREEGVLAFRPEDGRLASVRAPGLLAARVERSEHGGSEANVFLRLDPSSEACVVRIPSAELDLWPRGRECWLSVNRAKAWFFPQSGAPAEQAVERYLA